jgi:sarcosine oxidase subunit beta
VRAKVVIIGGGVIGVSIALRAAQKTDALREPAVVLEKSRLGAGSTGRSGAVLRQHYADLGLAAMARDSLRYFTNFEASTGRSIGFRRTGVLSLAGPERPETLEQVRSNVERMASIGIDIRLLEAPKIREMVPDIQVADGALGAWERHGGFVDPQATVESFAALGRTYGCATRLGVSAQKLVIEDGCVVGVDTDEGRYETERVVVCAGPWTYKFLADHDIQLPLKTVRPEQYFHGMPLTDEQQAALDAETSEMRWRPDLEDPMEKLQEQLGGADEIVSDLPHPVLIDMEKGFYSRCEPDLGRTRVGSISYAEDEELTDPDSLSEEVGPEVRSWARRVLIERLPYYADYPEAGAEAAWYTLTPDAQALAGPVRGVQGLFVATGFSGHGFKLAPSIAEGMTQMLFDEPVSAFSPEFFDPYRFEGTEPEWTGSFGL